MVDCEAALARAQGRLVELVSNARERDYEVCAALYEIWKKELWRAQHRSFQAWAVVVAQPLGMSRTYALKRAQLIDQGFNRSDFERAGMSKLIRLLGLKPVDRRVLARVAGKLTRKELEERVYAARGKALVRSRQRLSPQQVVLVGQVAQSIQRLAASMGVSPSRYVEMMVGIMVRKAVA